MILNLIVTSGRNFPKVGELAPESSISISYLDETIEGSAKEPSVDPLYNISSPLGENETRPAEAMANLFEKESITAVIRMKKVIPEPDPDDPVAKKGKGAAKKAPAKAAGGKGKGKAKDSGEPEFFEFGSVTVPLSSMGLGGASEYDQWLPVEVLPEAQAVIDQEKEEYEAEQKAKAEAAEKEYTPPIEDPSVPEVQIVLRRAAPLLSKEDIDGGVTFELKIDGVFSISSVMQLDGEATPEDHPYKYELRTKLPLSTGYEEELVFSPGAVHLPKNEKPAQEPDYESLTVREAHWKKSEDFGQYLAWTSGAKEVLTKEVDVLQKSSVWMSQKAQKELLGRIRKDGGLQITLNRVAKEEGVADPQPEKWLARADLDIGKFFTPGTVEVTTRGKLLEVEPEAGEADEEEAKEEKAPAKKPAAKKAAGGAKGKGGKVDLIETDEEGNPYVNAKSYLMVSTMVTGALVPYPPRPTEPSIKVSDIVPQREIVEKQEDLQKVALDKFKLELNDIFDLISDEFTSFKAGDSGSDEAELRKRFIYHLNTSGIYYTISEKLKLAVVKVSKEHFGGKLEEAPDTAYSELYSFLMDHAHESLNERLHMPQGSHEDLDVSKLPPEMVKRRLLKLKDEAVLLQNYEDAATYLEEIIGVDNNDPDVWLQFAQFCLEAGELSRAEEALRETLSISDENPVALTLYGALLMLGEDYVRAEPLLRKATDIDSVALVPWILLAYLYHYIDKSDDTILFVRMAEKLQEQAGSDVPIKVLAGRYLLDEHLAELAHRILGIQNGELGEAVTPEQYEIDVLFAQAYILREDFSRAEEHLQSCLAEKNDFAEAWTLMGDLHFILGRTDEAKSAYETALVLPDSELAVRSLYHIGQLYLTNGEFAKAKVVFTEACERFEENSSILCGLGIAHFRLGEFEPAERAFAEANVVNNRDSTVWGYLALLCLVADRDGEAAVSLREAKRHGLKDAALLRELGEKYLAKNEHAVAQTLFRDFVAAHGGMVAHQLLADALLEGGDVDEALREYSLVMANGASVDDRRYAQQHIYDILVSQHRTKEATEILNAQL